MNKISYTIAVNLYRYFIGWLSNSPEFRKAKNTVIGNCVFCILVMKNFINLRFVSLLAIGFYDVSIQHRRL